MFFTFIQFGTPDITSNQIQLPVKLEITNPLIVPVPVQNIKINFFTKFQGDFVKIGETPSMGNITFDPGANEVIAYPVIFFDQIENLFSTLNFKTFLTNDLAEVRIDLILTVGIIPVTIPVFARFNFASLIAKLV